MSVRVRTTPEAGAQFRDIDDWWFRNRLAAPDLFLAKPAAAFEIIGHTPQIGRLYRQTPVHGTRRVLPNVTRCHVYYVAAILFASEFYPTEAPAPSLDELCRAIQVDRIGVVGEIANQVIGF